MEEQRQDEQLERIYNSSVLVQDVVLNMYWKRWTIGHGCGRGSGSSVLMERHDNDDDNVCVCMCVNMFNIIYLTSSSLNNTHRLVYLQHYWNAGIKKKHTQASNTHIHQQTLKSSNLSTWWK